MQKEVKQKQFERIMDANYNRAKEGLRVLEDMMRFVLDEKSLTGRYKRARHDLSKLIAMFDRKEIVASRNIVGDVGRQTISSEQKRSNIMDLAYANAQRVKESLRVLEEFAKLKNKSAAEGLKRLRYRVYDLEKKTLERL